MEYEAFIQSISFWGYAFLFLLIFLENCGAPLPALTVALVMAALAAGGNFEFWFIYLISVTSGTIGGFAGYWLGARGGRALILRFGRLIFITPKRFELAEKVFQKHGSKGILLRCYLPFLCIWGCNLAGIARLNFRRFAFFNIAGMVLWSTTNLTLGFFLGRSFDTLNKLLNGFVAIVVVLIVVAAFIVWRKNQKKDPTIASKQLVPEPVLITVEEPDIIQRH
jgi:membrane protein DedA with SNARE-associated domain